MKICVICVICVLMMFPANGQKLNDVYLQAKAAMVMENYAEAAQKILTIPANERTANMYLTL